MTILADQVDEHIWNIERNNIRAAALAEGWDKGKVEGIELGVMQNKTQTVLKMIRRNMPVEDIADISELSIDKVKEILKTAAVLH